MRTDGLQALVEQLAVANAERQQGRDVCPPGAAERLCVYGTLAPGRSNHREVAHLGGTWQPVSVTGRLARRRYPVFTFDGNAAAVPMLLLQAPALQTAWPQLDRFEGAQYRRILVPALLDYEPPVAAFVFVAVDPVIG